MIIFFLIINFFLFWCLFLLFLPKIVMEFTGHLLDFGKKSAMEHFDYHRAPLVEITGFSSTCRPVAEEMESPSVFPSFIILSSHCRLQSLRLISDGQVQCFHC